MIHARHGLEQLAENLVWRADARRRKGQRVGIGLGASDELGDRIDVQRRIHHEAELRQPNDRDRIEVRGQIVRHMLLQERQQRDDARRMQERIAVGHRARRIGDADLAAGARLVVDNEGAVHLALQHLGLVARQNVGRAARRERHHDSHRP